MDAIYIPQLVQASQKTERLVINERLADLDSLTPVKGELRLTHQGTYLQVSAQIETIVTLTCDRCLQQYNYRLAASVSEMLWFETPESEDAEEPVDLTLADPVETISPQGYFEPEDWLYQQLCLQWPHRQICGQNCTGMDQQLMTTGHQGGDLRWAALEGLKQSLTNAQDSSL